MGYGLWVNLIPTCRAPARCESERRGGGGGGDGERIERGWRDVNERAVLN
jgi:hypothetical protein